MVHTDKEVGGFAMSSVPSMNLGVSNLLQSLSNVGSSVLTSSKVTSAIEKAPTSDIVEMSMEAQQLQNMDTLFGISSNSSSTTTNPLTSLETLLAGSNAAESQSSTSAASSSSSSSTATSTPAQQMTEAQANSQAAEIQALLGTSTTTSGTNSLFSVLG